MWGEAPCSNVLLNEVALAVLLLIAFFLARSKKKTATKRKNMDVLRLL
jgi:hypothetical protein